MATVNQSESGRAWEYGLARAASDILAVPLLVSNPQIKAQKSYGFLDEQEKSRIEVASNEAASLLKAYDDSLNEAASVTMQPDMQGSSGDVRDIVIHTSDGKEIGISAKNHSDAVKHSRRSLTIDFGYQWYGKPCSEEFIRSVTPIWNRLTSLKEEGVKWRDIPDMSQAIYAPVFRAFLAEVNTAPANKLLRYMLGIKDFYKVMKDDEDVHIQSFNFDGTLGWGRKLPIPNRIIDIEQTQETTAVITFNNSWSLSLRLHSVKSNAPPAMEIEVDFVGVPIELYNHFIKYRQSERALRLG